jgi:hypothetical protein
MSNVSKDVPSQDHKKVVCSCLNLLLHPIFNFIQTLEKYSVKDENLYNTDNWILKSYNVMLYENKFF